MEAVYPTFFKPPTTNAGVMIQQTITPLPSIANMIAQAGLPFNQCELEILQRNEQPAMKERVQMNIIPAPKPRRTTFSAQQKSVLQHWFRTHINYPYPTTGEKQMLMNETGLNKSQINVWFANKRVRAGIAGPSPNRRYDQARDKHKEIHFEDNQ